MEKCDICKEHTNTSIEKIKSRMVSVCDWCLGEYEDHCDREREERKINWNER